MILIPLDFMLSFLEAAVIPMPSTRPPANALKARSSQAIAGNNLRLTGTVEGSAWQQITKKRDMW